MLNLVLLVLTESGRLVGWANVSGASGTLFRLDPTNAQGYVAGTPTSARFTVVDTGELTISGGTVVELQPVDPSS